VNVQNLCRAGGRVWTFEPGRNSKRAWLHARPVDCAIVRASGKPQCHPHTDEPVGPILLPVLLAIHYLYEHCHRTSFAQFLVDQVEMIKRLGAGEVDREESIGRDLDEMIDAGSSILRQPGQHLVSTDVQLAQSRLNFGLNVRCCKVLCPNGTGRSLRIASAPSGLRCVPRSAGAAPQRPVA
jgi:hypothetical protein